MGCQNGMWGVLMYLKSESVLVQLGEGRLGQVRTCQVRTGQVRTGQVMTGPNIFLELIKLFWTRLFFST